MVTNEPVVREAEQIIETYRRDNRMPILTLGTHPTREQWLQRQPFWDTGEWQRTSGAPSKIATADELADIRAELEEEYSRLLREMRRAVGEDKENLRCYRRHCRRALKQLDDDKVPVIFSFLEERLPLTVALAQRQREQERAEYEAHAARHRAEREDPAGWDRELQRQREWDRRFRPWLEDES